MTTTPPAPTPVPTPPPQPSSVLVEHWPTVLMGSAANWAAWIALGLPDLVAWILSHLDSVPPELLSLENRNIARIALVSIAVPVARIIKQEALRRALDRKTAAQFRSLKEK